MQRTHQLQNRHPAVSEAPADTSEEVPSEDPSVTPVLSVTETPSESEDEDQQKRSRTYGNTRTI